MFVFDETKCFELLLRFHKPQQKTIPKVKRSGTTKTLQMAEGKISSLKVMCRARRVIPDSYFRQMTQ